MDEIAKVLVDAITNAGSVALGKAKHRAH